MLAKGISVIVTTYNWPLALDAVLRSLSEQVKALFLHSVPVDIHIADDGSKVATKKCIESWQAKMPVPLYHHWHQDEGFRAAKIRNIAIAQCKQPYIIFIDGDCIPARDFLLQHLKLRKISWFVAGNRMLLSRDFSYRILKENITVEEWTLPKWIREKIVGNCNRWLPACRLPLGFLRYQTPKKWKGAKTCNLAVWREDLITINGFDENFQGWGFEDSDLVVRLQAAGIRRKEGRYGAVVYHCWHPDAPRTHAQENLERLESLLQHKVPFRAELGLTQYDLHSS